MHSFAYLTSLRAFTDIVFPSHATLSSIERHRSPGPRADCGTCGLSPGALSTENNEHVSILYYLPRKPQVFWGPNTETTSTRNSLPPTSRRLLVRRPTKTRGKRAASRSRGRLSSAADFFLDSKPLCIHRRPVFGLSAHRLPTKPRKFERSGIIRLEASIFGARTKWGNHWREYALRAGPTSPLLDQNGINLQSLPETLHV